MTSDPGKMQEWIRNDLVHFGHDETFVPCIKSYLRDRELQTPYSVFYQDGRAATKRLRDLMGGDCFDFPKDETVLQEIVEMLTSGEDVVLDFFAGSGTTGHAVMAQNALDGGRRRYLLVQLPEALDIQNRDQAAAAECCVRLGKPHNIAELTKQRLRLAAKRVRAENPGFAGDLGFRVFRLATSNIRSWEPDSDNLERSLLDSVDHLRPGRTETDILYELLLKRGLDLFVPIDMRRVSDKCLYAIGGGVLLACLAEEIERSEIEPLAQAIIEWREALAPAGQCVCVFRDSAFPDDVAKTNMAAILEQHGISNVISL
jgi:adenine-specific DNA-methyltransferase